MTKLERWWSELARRKYEAYIQYNCVPYVRVYLPGALHRSYKGVEI